MTLNFTETFSLKSLKSLKSLMVIITAITIDNAIIKIFLFLTSIDIILVPSTFGAATHFLGRTLMIEILYSSNFF
jgi:hypothetical protein